MNGTENVATGPDALFSNTTGNNNVANGPTALRSNTTGNNNVAAGLNALRNSTTGSANVAIGRNAGKNLTTGSNNVAIANAGKAGEAGTVRIGTDGTQTATYIAGISTTPLSGATQPVVVKSNGQLGVAPAASAKTHAAKALSVADGRRMMAEIERLKARVQKLGG